MNFITLTFWPLNSIPNILEVIIMTMMTMLIGPQFWWFCAIITIIIIMMMTLMLMMTMDRAVIIVGVHCGIVTTSADWANVATTWKSLSTPSIPHFMSSPWWDIQWWWCLWCHLHDDNNGDDDADWASNELYWQHLTNAVITQRTNLDPHPNITPDVTSHFSSHLPDCSCTILTPARNTCYTRSFLTPCWLVWSISPWVWQNEIVADQLSWSCDPLHNTYCINSILHHTF